jgi:hypothetical protein
MIKDRQRDQQSPIGGVNAGKAAGRVMTESRSAANIPPMHPSNDKTTEDEKKIDTDVKLTKQAMKGSDTAVSVLPKQMIGMMHDDQNSSQPAQHLDTAQDAFFFQQTGFFWFAAFSGGSRWRVLN